MPIDNGGKLIFVPVFVAVENTLLLDMMSVENDGGVSADGRNSRMHLYAGYPRSAEIIT